MIIPNSGLLFWATLYMQAHTMIVSRLTYRYCCFCYLWY